MEHTPTPWLWSHRHGEICHVSQEDDQSFGMHCPVDLQDEANATRIVACVNYCAGMHNIEMEYAIKIGFPAREHLLKVMGERGKLADDYRTQGLSLQAAKSMQAGETERADKAEAQRDRLAEATRNFLDMYIRMAESGDAGFFDPEKEEEVIAVRAALAAVKGE